jgi:hypothetical protein
MTFQNELFAERKRPVDYECNSRRSSSSSYGLQLEDRGVQK